MKKRLLHLLALAASLVCGAPSLLAQTSAFTYQGRLNDGPAPASGTYDLRFAIYDAATAGAQQGGAVTTNAAAVSNGLFTVTLDFGANVFTNGGGRWLEIAARTNGGGAFTTLNPRQPLTAVPYAIQALNGTPGPQGPTGLTGSQGLQGPQGLPGSSDGWSRTGNAGANPTNGAFLGTTDNLPLDFKVNGQRGLRIQGGGVDGSGMPNLIGGNAANSISAGSDGSVIGGGGLGGANSITGNADNATIAGGKNNTVSQSDGFIGGGVNNTAVAAGATIAGGYGNTAGGFLSTVGGGLGNTASGSKATVAGGQDNIASEFWSAVGGGVNNTASGDQASVPGGRDNTASGAYSFAAGNRAKAYHQGAFVWADSQNADFASTAPNQFLIRASGGVGIGTIDPAGAALRVAGTVAVNGNQSITGALRVDAAGENDGAFFGAPGITFGLSNSGEGIISKRTVGGNQFGLDFYTGFFARLSIANGGNVGINKTNPATALDVNGTVKATSFTGDGSGLTGVAAAGYSGAIGDGQLTANIARRNAANTFTGDQTVQGNLISSGSVTATGFSGSGSGLTGVAKLGSSNVFAVGGSFNGTVTATAFSGNGSALTGVAALGGANTFLSDNTFIGLIAAETMNSSTSVRVDARGLNNGANFGTGAPGLVFGESGSGEGIASKRTSGGNQFGLDFYTSYTTRLSINGGIGGGRVGIGRVSSANQLEVEGNASKTAAGSWLANSDRRIKQDITPVTGALDTLNRVRLVSFRYTDAYRSSHPSVDERPYLNVVAQEFAEVFPGHVKSSGEKLPDGSEILQVDTYPLTIYAAAAVQELAAKVESGNRKAEEKDAKIAALEARLEKLERLMEAKGGAR